MGGHFILKKIFKKFVTREVLLIPKDCLGRGPIPIKLAALGFYPTLIISKTPKVGTRDGVNIILYPKVSFHIDKMNNFFFLKF